MSVGMAPAGEEGTGDPDRGEGAPSGSRRSVMGEAPAGVARLGSTRIDSSYRGGARKNEARSRPPKAGGKSPGDWTGPGGGKLAGSPRPVPKKTGPPLREARSGLGRLLRTVVESRRRSTRAAGQAREEQAPDDSGADGGRSSRGLGRNGRSSLGRNGRSRLGRHALGDHARTAAVAVRATTGNHATLDGVASRVATAARATARDGTTLDHLTTTTARAAARSRGGIAAVAAVAAAVAGRSGRGSAVATTGSLLGMELGEKANALLAVAAGSSGRSRSRSSLAARITSRSGFGSRSAVAALFGVELGEQTAARLAAMTTLTGNRTRLTADEADGDERDDHRNRRTEETLHLESPGRKNRTLRDPNRPSRTASDPGRPPDRSKDVASPDGISQPERRAPCGTPRQPAALPCKCCGLAKDCRLGSLGRRLTAGGEVSRTGPDRQLTINGGAGVGWEVWAGNPGHNRGGMAENLGLRSHKKRRPGGVSRSPSAFC